LERKNILFISSWFPNKLEPTNGNFVQRHAEAVSLKHNVEALHAIGDFNQDVKYLIDIQVVNGIQTVTVYYRNSKNPVQNFFRRMRAYSIGFKKLSRPDLVHANILHNNMLFAVYIKKRFGIPFVVTEHWTALRKVNTTVTSGLIKKTAKYIGNQAKKIMPVSQDLLLGLEDIGISTAMKVIPNVVDTHLFSEGKRNDEFTFIHVSNLIPRKNADKILEAAIKLIKQGYHFKLQLGGDGNEDVIKELHIKVKDNSVESHIEIFGIQTIEQVAKRMQNSHTFILFSDDENQPCVIAEAFASGLNVISTKVGGIAEFFPKNAGILLEKVDTDLLEEAMIRMMTTDFANGKSLRQYAERNFSREVIALQYSDIYREVLKK